MTLSQVPHSRRFDVFPRNSLPTTSELVEPWRATPPLNRSTGRSSQPSRILIGWFSQTLSLDWALAVPITERHWFLTLLQEGVGVDMSPRALVASGF